MKLRSSHAYNLPGHYPLPKGESEHGEMPAAAKKYLDGLVKAGVVEMLDPPKPLVKATPPAPAMEPSQPAADDGDADGAKKRTKKKE